MVSYLAARARRLPPRLASTQCDLRTSGKVIDLRTTGVSEVRATLLDSARAVQTTRGFRKGNDCAGAVEASIDRGASLQRRYTGL